LHKEKEVEAMQRHDDATQGMLSWEWDLSGTLFHRQPPATSHQPPATMDVRLTTRPNSDY
jgi:hypothetical protein